MAGGFLAAAGKKTTDIRGFLREAAGGNGIKYRAVKGEKHYLYIPFTQVKTQDEEGNGIIKNEIVAMYGSVHEWETPDGKYRSTICLKDVIRTSDDEKTQLNDGSCPFCEKVGDAWEIYKYRCELEEKACGLIGDELIRHMDGVKGANGMVEKAGFKKQAADERKAKDANPYLYIQVVQYRIGPDGNVIIGQNKLPEYDLRIMKLSKSRVEKMQQLVENSGLKMPGADIVIEYPKDAENAALVVSKSTTAPVFPTASITYTHKGLLEAIANDVAKFTWDGIEKAFQEWQGMTTLEARNTIGDLFTKWDEYKAELTVNPNARYMEYVGASAANNNPALNVGAAPIGVPGLATGGQIGVTGMGAAPVVNAGAGPVVIPGMSVGANVNGAAVGIPGMGEIPDVNAIFNNNKGSSSIEI